MALHDALTFDAATRIGGPNGSIRMEREQGHDGNEGLKLTVERLEAVRRDLGGEMSFADTLHLGAAVAAEMIGGGRVAFRPGRKDKKACPPRGRLPAADSAGSLEAVGRRAGLSRRHFVALAGFHPFAGVLGDHDRGLTSFEQEWKEEPFCMGNAVYKDLLQGGGRAVPLPFAPCWKTKSSRPSAPSLRRTRGRGSETTPGPSPPRRNSGWRRRRRRGQELTQWRPWATNCLAGWTEGASLAGLWPFPARWAAWQR